VATISYPWNFPAAIPIWKIAPALVAGNSVVFKPASLVPATAELLMQCFVDAGLPAGVLNMVIGSGGEVGNTFVDHPDVRLVSFTGSTDIGLGIYKRAAARGIRAQCEMGGKNPVIVCDDADIDLAVSGVYNGAFGSTGQRCTATSRVHRSAWCGRRLPRALVGTSRQNENRQSPRYRCRHGPEISMPRNSKPSSITIDIGKNQGAELLIGGNRITSGDCANGFFVEPTIFDKVRTDMRIHNEEIFGRCCRWSVSKASNEAIEVANHSEFGLTSSIYTRDLSRTFRYIHEIETGITHVNSPTLGGEAQMPFGGMKNTGVGHANKAPRILIFIPKPRPSISTLPAPNAKVSCTRLAMRQNAHNHATARQVRWRVRLRLYVVLQVERSNVDAPLRSGTSLVFVGSVCEFRLQPCACQRTPLVCVFYSDTYHDVIITLVAAILAGGRQP
jgi:aldehyde dehydrogenase (NAD+)